MAGCCREVALYFPTWKECEKIQLNCEISGSTLFCDNGKQAKHGILHFVGCVQNEFKCIMYAYRQVESLLKYMTKYSIYVFLEPRKDPGPKIPEKIRIEFRPRTNSAWSHVQEQAQNPRLRMTVRPDRCLSSLVRFLEQKWRPHRLKLVSFFQYLTELDTCIYV